MRTRVVLLLALVAAAVAAAPADGASKYRNCRQVNFTPNSDDVAAHVQVRGVSCRYARAFIRSTDGVPGRDTRGWRCGRKRFEGELLLPYSQFRCQRGTRVMRWKRY